MNSLLFPMTVHVTWVALLYAALTVARAPAVWGVGRSSDGSNPWATVERRLSANLSNQFEWPLFFYVACLWLQQAQAVGPTHVALAWVFVLGRVIHTAVQVGTTNVRLRGVVFMLNFAAVLAMWVAAIATPSW